MSKGGGDAPSPDPKIGQAALKQAETGEEWLSFAKDAFKVSTARQAELDVITKQVMNQQLGIADDQARWSRDDRSRYERTFRPIEDEFVAEATEYGSPERQEAAAAEAKADVTAAAHQARAAARRDAAGVGINPTSGRYAGIDRAAEMGGSLAVAGAQNVARTQQRDKGLALKADVVNMGRGLPAQSAQAAAMGLSAGSGAVGLGLAGNQQQIQSAGIVGQGYQGQMAGYAGQANTLSQDYQNRLSGWKAQQEVNSANAAGIGSALGGVAGLFMMSDENVKEDKEEIPEGEALERLNAMPVEKWKYKEGVADGAEHVGTYAQDFQEQTGQGDGTTIAVQDAIGVTMKAVQDLDAKVEKIAKVVGIGLAPMRDPDNPASRGPIQKARKPESQKSGPSGIRRAA